MNSVLTKNVDVSVIILTWNSAKYIRQCVLSIINDIQNALLSLEFLIVDNGSLDETKDFITALKNKYPFIHPIFLNQNYGTTKSRNLALRRANGKFIAIVDSDIICNQGCFSKLIQRIKQDSSIGLVVPLIKYPDGRYQKSTDDFPTLFSKIYRYFFLKKIEANEQIPNEGPVQYAISAFWLLKREVLHSVGYFDENIFYSPEDLDLCLRMWKAGYMIYFVPSATVLHFAQEHSRSVTNYRFFLSHLKGLFYLFFKHRFMFRKPKVDLKLT